MGSQTILVADDEALFRQSAADSLRARFRGVKVLEAEDGAAALAILERTPVDVLVTDLRMPEADGLELVAWVAGRRLPIQIIVLTAHASEQTRKALDELGALVCLDKPIELSALHDAVDRMLHLPRAHLGGVTLPGFVQLLEAEKRTCALRVQSIEGAGTLVFDGGVIVDAWSRELEGDAAAMAILSLRDCTLDIIGSMPAQARRVTQPLSYLLLESARRLDEAEGSAKGLWEVLRVAAEAALSGPESALDPWSELDVNEKEKETIMANIQQSMRMAMEIEGAVAVALVDYQSGMTLGQAGGGAGLDLELAAAGNTEVVRAKMRVMSSLNLDDTIEDILITLSKQFHLIRPLRKGGSSLFLYVVIDRKRGNLALARHQVQKIEAELTV